MDQGLVSIINNTVGCRRTYTWNDIYVCLDKLVDLMSSETDQDE